MKKMRSHPLKILENTSRFLILLLLPLLRALLSSFSGFYTWLAGAWFDLLIIALILGLGIYNWFVFTFSFDEEGIWLKKGILIRKQRYIAYHDLTSISMEYPWYYRPFRAVHLKADTDGGFAQLPDLSITIRKDLAEHFLKEAKLPYRQPTDRKRSYVPGNFYIAVFSIITSNSLTGVIFASTSISKAGDIFGQEIKDRIMDEFTKITRLLAFGLPPAAAAVGYTILFCWFLSFLINLAHHLKFRSSRRGQLLDVSAGIFTKRYYSISVHRINSLIIRQSMISKIFGFFSVFIHCSGYGKSKNEMNVLMPSGEADELAANLNLLLPEIPLADRQIKPRLINITRFLIPPLTLIGIGLGTGLVGVHFFPKMRTIIIFLMIIFELPSVWWLMIKVYAFFFTGIGAREEVVTLRFTRGYQIITCSIPKEKIVKVQFCQTLFQAATKCCDVDFYIYGEGRQRKKVSNLYLPDVLKLLHLPDADHQISPADTISLWKSNLKKSIKKENKKPEE